ncbi:hypothetical protein BGX24_005897 [Mortierella sp. AD032]|nr:hypothetical protein BGX24_005897 [Mortierella sp. AD032]
MTLAPAPTSKFDLYKAQMDRVRSSHRLHMHGHGRSASSSTASPTTPPTSPATATSGTVGRNGSKSSLVNNNVERLPSPLSRRGSRSIATADPLCQALQRSPLEEQQDRWREEWLRPSGAMSSMFRDTPSKFNCPHCGAIKVVSNIQFVPGLMSYLVAFGLMFLTLGTLSYLPFRRDHEGTKDCIHWCPECEQRVARFNRANSTWEWI